MFAQGFLKNEMDLRNGNKTKTESRNRNDQWKMLDEGYINI